MESRGRTRGSSREQPAPRVPLGKMTWCQFPCEGQWCHDCSAPLLKVLVLTDTNVKVHTEYNGRC